MTQEQWTALANRLHKEMGIDLFDEDGYVEMDQLKKLVTIIAEAGNE